MQRSCTPSDVCPAVSDHCRHLWGAWADDSGRGNDHGKPHGDERLFLKKTIDVGPARALGHSTSASSIRRSSYTSWPIGPTRRLIYSIRKMPNFIGRVGDVCPAGNPAPHFCFQGVVSVGGVVNNNLSGPDGVVIVDHKEIWAGDGDSRIKVIDIKTRSFVTTISTGGTVPG